MFVNSYAEFGVQVRRLDVGPWRIFTAAVSKQTK
jgi:hypothetical protein